MTSDDAVHLSQVDSLVVASRALLAIVARTIAPALERVSMQQFRVLVVLVGAGPHRLRRSRTSVTAPDPVRPVSTEAAARSAAGITPAAGCAR